MTTLLGFILGAALGSFALVWAERTLQKESILGRSYCPHCHKKLAWFDLIPLLSYLMTKGQCRYCKKPIGIKNFIFELVLGILIAAMFWQSGWQDSFWQLGLKVFFITTLVTLTWTDLKKGLIPDKIVNPAILISFVLIIGLGGSEFLVNSLLAAFFIGGFFYLLIIITQGRGMGGGDVKLGVLMGLVLGFPAALVAAMAAFLSGAVSGILLIFLGRKKLKQTIPFGPFLALGSILTLFWGNQIINWYLHLMW